jgi:pyruvate,water dikinase
MKYAFRISEIADQSPSVLGGKAHTLARMIRAGLRVPDGLCIPVQAYQYYVTSTGLLDRIMTTLFRKKFEDMRWEEIWDVSLRVRNLFLVTPLPQDIQGDVLKDVTDTLNGKAVVVRSSAPGEDGATTSFAGLHDSFVNVVGAESILEHVRLVWASLWSDRALLYRQEIGLDIRHSAMAVLVQELVAGKRSGIAFTQDPGDASQGIVEAVHGLNQGLVDGSIEPDRWIINRESRSVLRHQDVQRSHAMLPGSEGIQIQPLSQDDSTRSPLNLDEVRRVFDQALSLEKLMNAPQDVEWTFLADSLFILQARPITRLNTAGPEDSRAWYLSLTRSFDNLKALHVRIEGVHIPAMEEEAKHRACLDLPSLSDEALAGEIEARLERQGHWEGIYKEDFIPFAHGMRLFGQFYNDLLRPADPYEFMDLLVGADLLSTRRNLLMEKLAENLRRDPSLAELVLADERASREGAFGALLDQLLAEFGDTSWGDVRLAHDRKAVVRLLLEMAKKAPGCDGKTPTDQEEKKRRFLTLVETDKRPFAADLLKLGQASYRLRDNDNVYLGRIKGQVLNAIAEGVRRLIARGLSDLPTSLPPEEVVKALRNPLHRPQGSPLGGAGLRERAVQQFDVKVRQVVGQPAGAGIGMGVARVITHSEELFSFRTGEVLVCDAIDPNMTFVVPLAVGIVERRGGMLIHGAIIAREYGIPCVTGVPDATTIIRTGDRVSVDGHLGIVVIG